MIKGEHGLMSRFLIRMHTVLFTVEDKRAVEAQRYNSHTAVPYAKHKRKQKSKALIQIFLSLFSWYEHKIVTRYNGDKLSCIAA